MLLHILKTHKMVAVQASLGFFFLTACTSIFFKNDEHLKTDHNSVPRHTNTEMLMMNPGLTSIDRNGGHCLVDRPYQVKSPEKNTEYSSRIGRASWYGSELHGKRTANGEIFDMNHLTAAHPTMPLPSYARVTNLKNGASLIVRVNDRGPFIHGRIIDLSRRAAQLLDYQDSGVTDVRVEYIGPAPVYRTDNHYLAPEDLKKTHSLHSTRAANK